MDDQTLWAEALIGRDAQSFLASDFGRTLVGISQQEARTAMQQLKQVLPWRWRRIQELQNKITQAERFEGYIRQLITAGNVAQQELEMRDDRSGSE